MKVERITSPDESTVFYSFLCPACDLHHAVPVARSTASPDPLWTFNDSLDRPTLYPAIEFDEGDICKSYVTDGRIRFLPGCSHGMSGKELELPDLEPIDPG